ncbi:MAG: hypothetical protein HFJ96_02565 [Peptococcaceae bacterium]|jgi:hypothetical protein|nr:hypothetical protein [Peptococcaceae bacterium]
MAKKNDKSSKTAHVLNLITSPAEKAAQKAAAEAETNLPEVDETTDSSAAGFASEAAEAAAVNQQAAQVHQPLIPPILQVAHRHDESLAEQIRGALEEELAPELAEAAAIQQPTPQPKAAPEPEPAPVQEPEPLPVQPEPAPMPQPAPEPEQPQFKLPASAIVSSFTIPEPPPLPPLDEELSFVNVMQMLVDSMAPRYIENFGLCSCTRCLEDVKALALTNLGPKYTVFRASERVPMLTVYEKRYASQVAAELTKACNVVKANPRHR